MNDRDTLLLIDKSFSDLMEQSLKELENTPINNIGPGGVARLILAKVNTHLSEFYQALKVQHTQAFLSKATGSSIDLIGKLLNCERISGEPDDAYKYRISKQTLVLEKANETALRLAVLSVPDVKDVIMREYSHGSGSFSVYPVLDDAYNWNSELINRIKLGIEDAKAYGIKAAVLQPRIAPVELRGRLLFKKDVSDADKALIQNQATQTIREYINTLKPGDEIQINKMEHMILNIHDSIIDVEFYHFRIKNRSMLIVDQESSWNERFVEAQTIDAILFS